MRTKAIGRLAIIILSGIFVSSTTPALANCGDDCGSGKPVNLQSFAKRHLAHLHHRHAHRIVSRHHDDSDKPRREARADTLPATIADAQAQMGGDSADPKAKVAASAIAATAGEVNDSGSVSPATPVQVLSQDELNDLDRAATNPNSPALKLPAAIANSHAEMYEPSAWSQTSGIGKAFIAFGVMLTFASAARMFMA